MSGRGGDYEDIVLDQSSVKNARGEPWGCYAPTRRVLMGISGVWSTKTDLPNDWVDIFSSSIFCQMTRKLFDFLQISTYFVDFPPKILSS
jgi:hypothetical protein